MVDFKECEVMSNILRGKGVGRSVSMVSGAEADKLVFTGGFQDSIDAPDISLPVWRRNAVKTAAVENQGKSVIRVRELQYVTSDKVALYTSL